MDLQGDKLTVGNPHSDVEGWSAHLKDAFGTTSHAFTDQAFGRLEVIARAKDTPAAKGAPMNGALALMGAIAPADELEAAIGEQIVAAHLVSMEFLAKAKHTDTIPKLEAYTNMATKLSRTMAVHVETLAKLRSGGKQTHEVRYVYVNGPAVFGDGTQAVFAGEGGGGFCGKAGQPHGRGAVPRLAPDAGLQVRGDESARLALSGPGDEGEAPMRVPRGQEPGSADRAGERPLHVGPVDAGDAGGSPAHARRSAGRGGGP